MLVYPVNCGTAHGVYTPQVYILKLPGDWHYNLQLSIENLEREITSQVLNHNQPTGVIIQGEST